MRYGRPLPPEEAAIELWRAGEENWDGWNFGPVMTTDQELTARSLIYLEERHCCAMNTVMYNNRLDDVACGRWAV